MHIFKFLKHLLKCLRNLKFGYRFPMMNEEIKPQLITEK